MQLIESSFHMSLARDPQFQSVMIKALEFLASRATLLRERSHHSTTLIALGLVVAIALLTGCGQSDKRKVPTPTIRASPNPVPAGPGKGTTTVSWDIGDRPKGEVYVSVDGKAEKLFVRGARGSKQAAWISAGSIFEFRLYEGPDRVALVASVRVTRTQ